MKKPTEKKILRCIKTAEKIVIALVSLAGWVKILLDTIKDICD